MSRTLVGILALTTLCLPLPALARHGSPPPAAGSAEILQADHGKAVEIDRRSHPALARAWDAIRAGDFRDPRLRDLPALGGARLLHDGGDWALVWLDDEDAGRLEAAGVRMNPPRPRPSETPRMGADGGTIAPRALTLYESLEHAVNADRMMEHLEAISTALQTRYYNTAGMQSATQYVLDRFVEYGLDDAYFDSFTYNGYAIRNVIGVKTGTLTPGRIYMICGHLDSTSPQAQTLAPGAEDNGTGSVGVLEAARLLAPLTTESTIYFVCFTAEEQGLIGSAHLASIADQQNWDLRGVLNMDMVGYDTSGPTDLWLEGFYGNPGSIALMDLLEDVANQYTDMAVYRYPNDGWGSDHVPFDDHGFPAILAIDYDWDSYPCYHQTCDVTSNVVPSQLRRMVVTVTIGGAQLAGLSTTLGSVGGHADKVDTGDDSGIVVEVLGTTYPAVVTASDGSFTVPDLLPGSYRLRASAAGYDAAEAPVSIQPGQETPILLSLEPLVASVIRGHVSLRDGGTMTSARVFMTGQGWATQPDDAGDYVLDPVIPGQVIVNADYPGKMPEARVVEVPSGEEVSGIDFDLEGLWTFEESDEGVHANVGWAWGSDALTGAHSGTLVWGTRLNANYDNCADYRLDLPPLDLHYYTSARLHFWHWYDTEAGYDGGNVQVSTDAGGTWIVVQPVSGYGGTLSGPCNPLAGQDGYSGVATSWREAIVDLGAYAGKAIRVRFWFGSDGGVRDRGWYLDDLSLEGNLAPSDVADGDSPARLEKLSDLRVLPNPARSGAAVRFRLGAAAPTWVTVHDATGRRVRSLLADAPLPAGERAVAWDGRDDAGRVLPGGVYWIRVFANGRTRGSSLTLLR